MTHRARHEKNERQKKPSRRKKKKPSMSESKKKPVDERVDEERGAADEPPQSEARPSEQRKQSREEENKNAKKPSTISRRKTRRTRPYESPCAWCEPVASPPAEVRCPQDWDRNTQDWRAKSGLLRICSPNPVFSGFVPGPIA